MNIFFTPENSNNFTAKGQFFASSRDKYSTVPPSSNETLVTNFILFGFGVNSAYTLIGRKVVMFK